MGQGIGQPDGLTAPLVKLSSGEFQIYDGASSTTDSQYVISLAVATLSVSERNTPGTRRARLCSP